MTVLPYTQSQVRRLIANIREWFALRRRSRELDKPWLIDRDGRVYQPTRKVVLKAKPLVKRDS